MDQKHSFFPLFSTNFFGVANDNFLKTLASFVMIGWVGDERTRAVLMGVTAGMLVLPYIFLSPLADRLTIIFSKRKILTLAKIAELPIIALAILGFAMHSIPIVICSIVVMGLQSSLYSPAKYALVRDVGGEDRISVGMGGMEGIAFLAVLGGTVAASYLSDHTAPWVWYATMLGLAAFGLALSLTIRASEAPNRAIHSINPIRFFLRARRMANRYPGLPTIISALCVFWAAAAMLQQGLILYGTQVLGLDSTHTGILLVLAAIGIVAGQILAGFVDRKHPLLELVPLTGAIAAVLLAILFFARLPPTVFGILLALIAFDLGFFKLPLDAEIQRQVKGPKLNTILAYFNQVTFLAMFIASAAYACIGWLLGPRAFLAVLSLGILVASFLFSIKCRRTLVAIGWWVLSRRYAVTADPLPTGKTLLVLPNHPALVDPLIVLSTYRNTVLSPLVDANYFHPQIFADILAQVNAVKVPNLRKRHSAGDVNAVRALDQQVLDSLSAGKNVIIYPSGHIYAENCEHIGTRQLTYNLCRALPPDVRVITLRTTGLWGSMFSRVGGRDTPNFALTLLWAIVLWLFVNPFRAKRKVNIHAEDQTETLREWSALTRLEFNNRLCDWYNAS